MTEANRECGLAAKAVPLQVSFRDFIVVSRVSSTVSVQRVTLQSTRNYSMRHHCRAVFRFTSFRLSKLQNQTNRWHSENEMSAFVSELLPRSFQLGWKMLVYYWADKKIDSRECTCFVTRSRRWHWHRPSHYPSKYNTVTIHQRAACRHVNFQPPPTHNARSCCRQLMAAETDQEAPRGVIC